MIKYLIQKIHSEIKFQFFGLKSHKYLFVLSPPFGGSTLMVKILETSKSVTVNNSQDQMEGMQLPELRYLYGNFEERWNEQFKYNFRSLDKGWKQFWNPKKHLLVEKSPPLILRGSELNEYFNPKANYIVLVRNPYALIESLVRRRGWDVETSANFVNFCFKAQKRNIVIFKDKCLLVKYEDLTNEPDQFKVNLSKFEKRLFDISVQGKFNSHNFKNKEMEIRDLNEEKLKVLGEENYLVAKRILLQIEETYIYFNYQV